VSVLALAVFLVSSSFASSANQVEHINWAVRLSPNNPEYLELFVDATNIASNRVVQSAFFEVNFYSGSRRIKEETISFLDERLRRLRPGSYHRFLRHSSRGATRVEGGQFIAYGAAAGSEPRADVPLPVVARGNSSDWNSAPDQGTLIDYWPPDVSASLRPAEINPEKPYYIVSVLSGKAMDVKDRSMDDWAPVIQTRLEEGISQQWRFEALHGGDEGYYTIKSSRSDKCLDVRLGDKADNTAIIQYSCNGGDGQKWRVVPKGEGYQLQAKHSGKVVDVAGESMDDVPLIQYGGHFGKNQQWTLREAP